jgi:hypothetical protein
MINKIKEVWNNYGFEIIILLCLSFLVLFGIFNKLVGIKGSYSSKKDILRSISGINNVNTTSNSRGPRESKGENECRRVLELLFNKSFPSQRPDFLRNPVTGGNFNLELDCYNSSMKLAVEYNGVQHYKYSPYFHKNNEQFINQKYRDDMKRRLCKERGVTLIEVPYTVKLHDIKDYIVKECIKYGYL